MKTSGFNNEGVNDKIPKDEGYIGKKKDWLRGFMK